MDVSDVKRSNAGSAGISQRVLRFNIRCDLVSAPPLHPRGACVLTLAAGRSSSMLRPLTLFVNPLPALIGPPYQPNLRAGCIQINGRR